MTSPHIDTEKLEIAKRYLVPKSLDKNGLKKNQVKYSQESLLHIANGYARERTGPAEGAAEDRKEAAAAEKAGGPDAGVMRFAIDKKTIEKHLGKPIFPEGEVKKADRPGMSVGLAWTSMGGDTLVIEATSVPGKEGFTLTGMMGDTMKESAAIAMTVARKIAIERYGVSGDWFEKNHIHLHIPEGATPKDGPSAGITMATALLSLMQGKTIAGRLVMTGELSLTGQVLPIGGLKEKTIAAQRNKAKHIVIPKQNVRALDEIPDQKNRLWRRWCLLWNPELR